MSKKYLPSLVVFALLLFWLFAVFSFYAWDINPGKWSQDARLFFGVLSTLLLIGYSGYFVSEIIMKDVKKTEHQNTAN